jgi:4-diphosphocytidyl-2-C-methyl-D-erythritol kinase
MVWGERLMALDLVAPAKLNLVLEVTGRRADGYHEIASLMQTIDLADRVRLEEAHSLEIEVQGQQVLGVPVEGPRNLAYRAAHALAEAARLPNVGARIVLEKRIPAGMGLGGGSSDAAAVLRGLNRLWGLDLDRKRLSRMAAEIGSDVAFFLWGGSALVRGRGELVEALPDAPQRVATLFLADLELEDKTRRMYSALTRSDFTSGHLASVAAEATRKGLSLSESEMYNAFDRHLGEIAPSLLGAMALCHSAGLATIACGSGPAFYSPLATSELPPLLLRELSHEWGVRAVGCRTLSRSEAMKLREV